MRTLSICFIINSFSLAGAELLVRVLASRLARSGHKVLIFALRKETRKEAREAFVKLASQPGIVLEEGDFASLKRPTHILSTGRKLRLIAQEFKPEIVHTHCELPDILGALFLWDLKTVLIRTAHNEVYFQKSPVVGRLAESAINRFGGFRQVVSISERIQRQNNGRISGKLIYNGLFEDSHNYSARRSDTFRAAGIVGRLTPQKGQLSFLRFLLKHYQDPDRMPFTLHLYGAGPDLAAIEATLPLFKGKVVMHGLITDQSEIYDAMDVLLIPSKFEGLSSVMLEAVGRGIPVISLDVSGARDVLEKWPVGRIVPDYEAMVREIEAETFPSIEIDASSTLREFFSIERFVSKHEELYFNAT